MTATTQRKREIELAEEIVQLGACLNECETAVRDAHEAKCRVIRLLALLGGQPGPDFLAA